MAAQGGVAHEEMAGGVGGADLLEERLEGDIVAYTPLGRFLFLIGVVGFPMQFLPSSGYQVAAHIREVDVASVEVAGGIALMLQGAGDGRQGCGTVGHLHHRHGGERWIAAEGAYRTSVGAVGVAIAVVEGDTFLLQLLQSGHGLGEDLAGTLHEDDDHVGALGVEQRVCEDALRGIAVFQECLAFCIVEERVFHNLADRLLERLEEIEYGVDGRVVEELVL